MVEPVLRLTGLNYKIMETKYRNHAVEYVSSMGGFDTGPVGLRCHALPIRQQPL